MLVQWFRGVDFWVYRHANGKGGGRAVMAVISLMKSGCSTDVSWIALTRGTGILMASSLLCSLRESHWCIHFKTPY